jgi:hypothetical protein
LLRALSTSLLPGRFLLIIFSISVNVPNFAKKSGSTAPVYFVISSATRVCRFLRVQKAAQKGHFSIAEEAIAQSYAKPSFARISRRCALGMPPCGGVFGVGLSRDKGLRQDSGKGL